MSQNINKIQKLIDKLADELQRSVEIDTPTFDMLCASAQYGAIDNCRLASIIYRSPPAEPIPWLLSHAIAQADAPVRIPENPDFNMLPRVCFPIRKNTQLCAYLWLFDTPPITEKELTQVESYLDTIAELLDPDIIQCADAVLANAPNAIATAQTAGFLPTDGTLTVHYFRNLNATSLPQLRKQPTPRPFLTTTYNNSVVVIERARNHNDSAIVLDTVARIATVEAVGSAAAVLASAGASAHRAEFMAEVAALTGVPALSWEDAGAWRALLGWELTEQSVYALSNDAADLINMDNRSLWPSVLCYLNNARSTTQTAKELFIHRATLHYRLDRARDIIGPALDCGWRCAALHLALQIYAALHNK